MSLTDLCWQHYQSDAYHDNHVQLGGPNVGYEVTVADRGECHYHEVGGLEQVQMSVTRSLEVLDTTNTTQTHKGLSVLRAYDGSITWPQGFAHSVAFKKRTHTSFGNYIHSCPRVCAVRPNSVCDPPQLFI